jgi:outer membrane usher protein
MSTAVAQTTPAALFGFTDPIRPAAVDLRPVILDVQINGQAVEATRPLLRRGAQILFEKSELEAWQLVVPASPAATVDGNDYYDLLTIPGLRWGLDDATQTVKLKVPPEAFQNSSARSRSSVRPPASESVFGAFLNYDVAIQRDRSGTHSSGYFDTAVSGAFGLAVTSFVLGQSAYAGNRSATRLDTYYRFDNPDALTRLTIGDAIARSATWSTPFRYGGIQFGTQFGLQPGYINYPTPTLRGSSGLPSAVEVYVNDTLRYQGRADAGPFTVPNVPVLTGAGEMRFAVTDALGVLRTVTTPYYVSSNLLRPGLSDYSVEFGWNRLFYGERSFEYGHPFGSGTWRKGMNDSATIELHGETGATSQTAGGGVTWVTEPMGEFAVHAAASHSSDSGNGRLLRTSFTRTSADWSFAVSRQITTRDFTQIGWQDSFTHVNGQTQVFAGRSFGRYGSLGSSFTQLRYNTGERIAVLSANWSIAVADGGSLSTYVARTRQQTGPDITSVGLTFTMMLGDRQTAAVSVQRLAGRNTTTAEVDRSTPADIDGGYGYRVVAAQGEASRSEAGLDWQGRYGAATAEAANSKGDMAARVRASGAIGTAGGLLFAARQSDDAFALVTVPETAGLKVYRENQHLGTTDSNGRALLSGLRAYEPNRISINSEDLPIQALIGTDAIQVVPRYKGVAAATFDITRHTLANVVVHLTNGQPLPPGIEVRGAGRTTTLLSGYGGAVSIDAPRANERFEARWRNGQCSFKLGALDETGQSRDSGPCVCMPFSTATP